MKINRLSMNLEARRPVSVAAGGNVILKIAQCIPPHIVQCARKTRIFLAVRSCSNGRGASRETLCRKATESCSDILEPRSQRFRGASDLAELAHLIGEDLRHAGINCRDEKVGRSREEIGK